MFPFFVHVQAHFSTNIMKFLYWLQLIATLRLPQVTFIVTTNCLLALCVPKVINEEEQLRRVVKSKHHD